jgi:V8-like Glu-specific endopeptidase
MSHSRTRALVLATAVLAAALAPAAVAGAAAPAKGDTARAEHDRIVAYWTPERMKAAKPRDFVRNADGSFSLAATPKAKPSGENKGKPGGDTTTSTTTVTGATWTLNETPVNELTGKVYFQFTETDGWICSGTVVDDGRDSASSLVLTAGHCVYDQATQRFASNWLFIPDFDEAPTYTCSRTEYGCWTATELVAHAGFTSETKFTTKATLHDFAVAVVGSGGKDGVVPDLDAAVGGSYGLEIDGVAAGDTLSAFGYPAAKKYSGNVLTYCSGPITTDPYNSGQTWGLACDMTGGSSGGPWFTGIDTKSGSGGAVGSLNSYGYRGLTYMFGPKFDQNTRAVYETAKTGTVTNGAVVRSSQSP